MIQMTTLGKGAKDGYDFGNSLGDVGNKKKNAREVADSRKESS